MKKYIVVLKIWLARFLSVEPEVRRIVDSVPISDGIKKEIATGIGVAVDAVIEKELPMLPATVKTAIKTEIASLIAQSALMK